MITASNPIAQRVTAAVQGIQATAERQYRDRITDASGAPAEFPGMSVSVRQHGEPIVDVATGVANLTDHRAITTHDTFLAGSVTKMFVADAAQRLAEQGKLDLDAPIATWHPELPNATRLTVRQVLHQRSGLSEYMNDLDYRTRLATNPEQAGDWNTARVFGAIKPRSNFTPGSRFEYSNSNYQLIADIVSRVNGTSLTQAIDELVVRPAGVESSDAFIFQAHGPSHSVTPYELTGSDGDGTTQPKAVERDASRFYVPGSLWRSTVNGEGAFVSTPAALARIGEEILRPGGALMSGPTRARALSEARFLTTRHEYDSRDLFHSHVTGYGPAIMHLELRTPQGRRLVLDGHEGDQFGEHAALYREPVSDTTIAVMVNTDLHPAGSGVVGAVLDAVLDGQKPR